MKKYNSILAVLIFTLFTSGAMAQMNYYVGGSGVSAAGYGSAVNLWNVGVGQGCMSNSPTGVPGTGVTGMWNTAIGAGGLDNATTGAHNTAAGAISLTSVLSGNDNTGVGYLAAYSNTTGSLITAVGSQALATTFANGSTAVGYMAATNSFSGTNDAFGDSALWSNSTGVNNVAIGRQSLASSTSSNCSALGYQSLTANTTGQYNTAVGGLSLLKVTTGGYNTGLGYGAGSLRNGYNYCTFVGWAADANSNWSNSSCLGYNAYALGSNYIQLGNTSTTYTVQAGPTALTSDGRFKKDISENVPGLNFIRQLRPVTYHYDMHKMDDFVYGEKSAEYEKAMGDAIDAKGRMLYSGFIAQEVEASAKKIGYDFSGIKKPQSEKDMYGLAYSEFVVPLVKSVQEQQDMIETQNKTISQQQDAIKALADKLDMVSSQLRDLKECCSNAASGNSNSPISIPQLYNAVPNPAANTTSIGYYIPEGYGPALIQITDMAGQMRQTINITGSGSSSVQVDLGGLANGNYVYSLNINGKPVDSKKLSIIQK